MAHIIVSVDRVAAALTRQLEEQTRLFEQAEAEYQKKLQINEEYRTTLYPRLSGLYQIFYEAWKSKWFKPEKPRLSDHSITFSVQPSRDVMGQIEKGYPEFLYRWIKEPGHLGQVTIPDKVRITYIPSDTHLQRINHQLRTLPKVGLIELTTDQAKDLGIHYDASEVVYRLA